MFKQYVFNLIFVLFICLMGCQSAHNIDVQGHRGCRGLLPENSIPAFKKALDLGVTTLELDIAISKDNRVVVTHEPYMNPEICLQPNGNPIGNFKDYNLYQIPYSTIKTFDCGTKTHTRFPQQKTLKVKKPLLSEVFDLVKAQKKTVNFNIEIKSEPNYYGVYTPYPKTYVALVLDEIKASGLQKHINLQSFDLEILKEIRRQSPQIPIALLVDENESIKQKINSLNVQPAPEIISPYYKLLNQKVITNLQDKGYKVIPWTINNKKMMQQFISWKVDGIITDYPNILIEILKQ